MKKLSYRFSTQSTDCYFDGRLSSLDEIVDRQHTVLITDEHVFAAHKKILATWKTIVLKAGEVHKVQDTVNYVIEQLIGYQADRKTVLVGVGGGVITDLTGFVAATYMRGLNFGFVPTTILAMVDASIGGKNGIDVGPYKNLVGTIRQPGFLLYDVSLLRSLPLPEWINGFAEIIKHSCIKDARLFGELEKVKLTHFRKDAVSLNKLIRKNVMIKSGVVQKDEFESGDRKLLNFGHTLGHAIETMYSLSHGQAISIGMSVACQLSDSFIGFKETKRVKGLLKQYGLPTVFDYDREKAFAILKMDKKKEKDQMNFILLKRVGAAQVYPIPMDELQRIFS